MRLAPLIGPDLQDAIAIGPDAVREAVSEFHPEDIAELLEDLSAKEAVLLVRALPTETAADVVERLSPQRQVLVFNAKRTTRRPCSLRSNGASPKPQRKCGSSFATSPKLPAV
jgi:hypothetical protein